MLTVIGNELLFFELLCIHIYLVCCRILFGIQYVYISITTGVRIIHIPGSNVSPFLQVAGSYYSKVINLVYTFKNVDHIDLEQDSDYLSTSDCHSSDRIQCSYFTERTIICQLCCLCVTEGKCERWLSMQGCIYNSNDGESKSLELQQLANTLQVSLVYSRVATQLVGDRKILIKTKS